MDFLEKLRNLPESKRKIILWSALFAAFVIMVFLWARNIWQGVENLRKGSLKNKIDTTPIEQEINKFQEDIKKETDNGQ